jgi:hypothetical protein
MILLDKNRAGLVVGAFLGIWHALWALLVWLGWGQRLIDFILWAHMIHVGYLVGPFDPLAAITLIVFTTTFGYVIGIFFAGVWNFLSRSRAAS